LSDYHDLSKQLAAVYGIPTRSLRIAAESG
jgi:hypothetical protein